MLRAVLAIVLLASTIAPISAQEGIPSYILVHVGEPSGSLHDALSALPLTDELVEIGITFRSITLAQATKEMNLSPDSQWAVVIYQDRKGRVLLQGSKLPTAENLRKALDEAGVKSPIKVLKDFLKQHPNHLDAKAHLLNHLHQTAIARTQHALQLNVKSIQELAKQGDIESFYRSMTVSFMADTSDFEGKKLSPEQDLQIWGSYVQELDTLFANGDWRLIDLPWNYRKPLVEFCSPLMVQACRRFLPKIEDFLEEYPTTNNFWGAYGKVYSMSEHNSARALLERLRIVPGHMLNPFALQFALSEERAKGNWGYIADTLWSNWSFNKYFLRLADEELGHRIEMPENRIKGQKEILWRDFYFQSLLESLIKTNRITEAETILMEFTKYPNLSYFLQRAAELAKNLGREDLQTEWQNFPTSEKTDQLDMDDLLAELKFAGHGRTFDIHMLVTNMEEKQLAQLWSIFSSDRLLDWNLGFFWQISPSMSTMLHKKEGWPEGETHWALMLSNGKILADGSGLPTEEALYQTFETISIDTYTNTLRRFIREYPTHSEAKLALIGNLERIANQRTSNILGADTEGDIARSLEQEDDIAICGEYASLLRQTFPQILKDCNKAGIFMNSTDFFIHSNEIKNIAPSLLFQIESALEQRPTNGVLWSLWINTFALVDNHHFKNLKERIVLSPMDDSMEFPPEGVRSSLLRKYIEMSKWQEIIEISEWRWEAMRNNMELNPSEMSEGWLWRYEMIYLLEAYLRLDKDHEANELVRVWSLCDWEEPKQSAIELANNCGKTALAEKWKK